MIRHIPTLQTARLVLRPFVPADGPTVEQLAGDPLVAATTLHIPHPYPAGAAAAWISHHPEAAENGLGFSFAITLKETGELLGCIGISGGNAHRVAEIGYWIGRPYWGRGYATEATRRIVQFGFEEVGLNRIIARYFSGNQASGKVMEKAGMKYEGTLRQEIFKNDHFEDLVCYAILRDEYAPATAAEVG